MPLKIEEMFAFVSVDEKGDEGVCGFTNPETGEWIPMVGADMARVDSLKGMARSIARITGRPVKLIKFRDRLEVEDIT